ncbi:FHA domain-containing protein [Psychrobacter sp. 16-MNA-CIBAN-0192]|uniref:FHA domain-containing protein n=1 Tax=Psychrobacter sp. 16-MNA-CIBAN-0192 TaxID=3140448 RepID=UPI0033245291
MNNSNNLTGTGDNNGNDNSSELGKSTWQLNALTEALGDLRLTVNDSLSVGRGSDNDVVLGSKQVSRNHALLSVLNGELYVKDLDSSNGTFVNDSRIENNKTKLLNSDDTVTFASFAFKVKKVTTPLAAVDNKQSLAEDTILAAAPNTLDTLAEPVSNVDTDLADTKTDDTDLTDIGAIDTGIMENEGLHKEIVESDLVNKEVSDSNFVDSNVEDTDVVESSVTNATLFNDNNITDAEIVDVEAVDSVSTNDIESAKKVEIEPVDTKFAEEMTPVVDAMNSEEDKVSPTFDDTSDVTAVANPTTSAPVEPLNRANAIVAYNANAPIVKQTIINDVLAATGSANHESFTAPVHTESFSQDTDLLTSEPVVEALEDKPQPMHQPEPLMTPEHDKTTTTALQEEADPDVLRAKQAATGQFSGTANLGQSRDIGTEGNNALDQAINNPATHNTIQKKPSGSWFIWVFIAIIIIGLALWLFNTGTV